MVSCSKFESAAGIPGDVADGSLPSRPGGSFPSRPRQIALRVAARAPSISAQRNYRAVTRRAQSRLTTSIGFAILFTDTWRGSEAVSPLGTVAWLATISSGPASEAMRDASCPPRPP